jgi:hypothetical protein
MPNISSQSGNLLHRGPLWILCYPFWTDRRKSTTRANLLQRPQGCMSGQGQTQKYPIKAIMSALAQLTDIAIWRPQVGSVRQGNVRNVGERRERLTGGFLITQVHRDEPKRRGLKNGRPYSGSALSNSHGGAAYS